MGSSIVQRGSSGFWASDVELALWCFLAGTQLRIEDPLDPLGDKLIAASQGAGIGCRDLNLHEVADTPERVDRLLRVSRALSDEGGEVSAEELTKAGVGGGSVIWERNVPVSVVSAISKQIVRLLTGEYRFGPNERPPSAWRVEVGEEPRGPDRRSN